MFLVPAWAWRGGAAARTVCVGVPVGAAAALVLAVLDSISGPSRIAAVSWLFVVFFAVEIFWWPRAQDRLLVNAERTGESARRALGQQQTDE
jgi:hypothetical protein